MSAFVADASVTLPWCFEDEADSWTNSLLQRLRGGDTIFVPAHWPTEVTNGLLTALRTKRVQPGRPELFWDELALLPISVEPALTPRQAQIVFTLAQQHKLTIYDAAYLELAKRLAIPLATLDTELVRAAQMEKVTLVPRF